MGPELGEAMVLFPAPVPAHQSELEAELFSAGGRLDTGLSLCIGPTRRKRLWCGSRDDFLQFPLRNRLDQDDGDSGFPIRESGVCNPVVPAPDAAYHTLNVAVMVMVSNTAQNPSAMSYNERGDRMIKVVARMS